MEAAVQISFESLLSQESNVVPFPTLASTPAPAPQIKPTLPVRKQTTSPIKDVAVLDQIKEKLLYSSKKYGYRNYMIFLFAIHTALRMNDVLTIRLQDIWNEDTLSVKDECPIFESKTNKIADIDFSDELRRELRDYILTLPNRSPYTPLFPSRKTQVKAPVKSSDGTYVEKDKDDTGCLSRKAMWNILHQIGEDLGIEHLACHTCRKTAAYHIYQQYKGELIEDQFSALDIVQQILNHSSSNVTLRYIGITPDVKKSVYRNLHL